LLALNTGLFDPVPLERMTAAQKAVEEATNGLPDDLGKRSTAGDRLSDADREQVTEATRGVLTAFQDTTSCATTLSTSAEADPVQR
jgi:F-type H+-transporting ATPase subunit alpha